MPKSSSGVAHDEYQRGFRAGTVLTAGPRFVFDPQEIQMLHAAVTIRIREFEKAKTSPTLCGLSQQLSQLKGWQELQRRLNSYGRVSLTQSPDDV